MSVEVLGRWSENSRARQEMRRRGLDSVTPWLTAMLLKTHLVKGVKVGDRKKSWDVLRTIEFIEKNVEHSEPVLDLGAYSSEILFSLQKVGFSKLTGIDLNPALPQMPGKDVIEFVTGDFTKTPFAAETFGAVTAISVIEHGFNSDNIFREVSRILKPGGYFLGSTDYWPEKIDTKGISAFGMAWTIFSKNELQNTIAEAAKHGLKPVGPLNFDAVEPTVKWFDKRYTFAWFALQKGSADVR